MRLVPGRALMAPALLALTVVVSACGQSADEAPESSVEASDSGGSGDTGSTSGAGEAPNPSGSTSESRTNDEQAFLDELTEFGLPTGMSAETTIEVGIGICLKIAEGVDDETILDQIRPLSSAIASQIEDIDTAGVGRALVDASRTHLCD